jgi:hypothetical protein
MKFNFSKEWCKQNADLEGNTEVGAGSMDIQDEAYSEAMDEIKRLKEENWHYSEIQVKLRWAMETNQNLLDEIARLKQRLDEMSQRETFKEWQSNQCTIALLKLLINGAADALERAPVLPPDIIKDIIEELRKAGQTEGQ